MVDVAAGELKLNKLPPVPPMAKDLLADNELLILSDFGSLSFVALVSGVSATEVGAGEEIAAPRLNIGAGADAGEALLAAEVVVVGNNAVLLLKSLFVLVPEAGLEDEEAKIDELEAGIPLVILEVLGEPPNEKAPLADVVVSLAEDEASNLPNIFTDF